MPKRPRQRRPVAPEDLGRSPDEPDHLLAVVLDRYDAVEENAYAGGEFIPSIAPEKLESLLRTANSTERSILATGRRLIRSGERALLADIARELGIDPATARQSVGRLARRAGIQRQKPKHDRVHGTERASLGQHSTRIERDSLDNDATSDESSTRTGAWTAFRAGEAAHTAPQRIVSVAEYQERKSREVAQIATRTAKHTA